MPVHHLTLRAYGTWLPDRPEGHVHWRRGFESSRPGLADAYRRRQRDAPATFDDHAQRHLLDELLIACRRQRLTPHAAATEATHLHALLSWRDERVATAVRARVKQSLTRRLNAAVGRRGEDGAGRWFAQGGDVSGVRTMEHFKRLRVVYLPGHAGWKWERGVGFWVGERGVGGEVVAGVGAAYAPLGHGS